MIKAPWLFIVTVELWQSKKKVKVALETRTSPKLNELFLGPLSTLSENLI